MDYFPSNWEIIACQETGTPCWLSGQGVHWGWGAGEWLGSLIRRWNRENRRSGVWQTAGKLSCEVATWKNVSNSGEANRAGADWKIYRPTPRPPTPPTPTPAVRVQLQCCMLKDWRRIEVWWGEFRCQSECEMNRCKIVCVCLPACLSSQHQWGAAVQQKVISLSAITLVSDLKGKKWVVTLDIIASKCQPEVNGPKLYAATLSP